MDLCFCIGRILICNVSSFLRLTVLSGDAINSRVISKDEAELVVTSYADGSGSLVMLDVGHVVVVHRLGHYHPILAKLVTCLEYLVVSCDLEAVEKDFPSGHLGAHCRVGNGEDDGPIMRRKEPIKDELE